ncbi:MAG: TrkA family potassium uptake protein [Firmicutes bacterium]|nr:TrkA family potassium uptake protein [Bacillota bacterium]
MKSILVIGLGRFGINTINKLNELGHQIMAIDTNEEKVNAVLPYVTDALIGNAANEQFLQTLGINHYDLCIVAIGDNFQNSLQITSLLKEMGAPYVVSRASSDVHAKFLLRNGADQIIYPEKQLAEWTAIRYSSDHIFDYIELDASCAIFEIEPPENWVGKSIAELNIRRKYNLNIVGIKIGGRVMIEINPDMQLHKEDRVLVAGSIKSIKKCFK